MLRTEIDTRGWRQGSFVDDSGLLRQVRRADGRAVETPAQTLGVVVTQDCDLIHRSFEAEPFAELLLVHQLSEDQWNRQFAAGRHPRQLHFRDAHGLPYAAASKDRAFFDRSILEAHSPSANRTLDDATLALIRSWLRKRYDRPAFPDTFEMRLKAERNRIRDVVEQHADNIDHIFVALDPRDELPTDAQYHIRRLTVVYDESKTEAERADKAAADLAVAINRCSGIEVDDFVAVPRTRFTLAHAALSDPWDFDYLSYSDE